MGWMHKSGRSFCWISHFVSICSRYCTQFIDICFVLFGRVFIWCRILAIGICFQYTHANWFARCLSSFRKLQLKYTNIKWISVVWKSRKQFGTNSEYSFSIQFSVLSLFRSHTSCIICIQMALILRKTPSVELIANLSIAFINISTQTREQGGEWERVRQRNRNRFSPLIFHQTTRRRILHTPISNKLKWNGFCLCKLLFFVLCFVSFSFSLFANDCQKSKCCIRTLVDVCFGSINRTSALWEDAVNLWRRKIRVYRSTFSYRNQLWLTSRMDMNYCSMRFSPSNHVSWW